MEDTVTKAEGIWWVEEHDNMFQVHLNFKEINGMKGSFRTFFILDTRESFLSGASRSYTLFQFIGDPDDNEKYEFFRSEKSSL